MMVDSSRFAVAGGGAPSSTQWRLRFPDTWLNSGNSCGISVVEMYEDAAGSELCAAATMTVDTQFSGFSPSNTNDGDLTTFWTTGVNAKPAGGHWLQATFGAARTINIVNLRGRGDGFREDPKEVVVEYYDGSAWQTYFDYATVPVWYNGEMRTFIEAASDFGTFASAHRYWRVGVPTANADALVIMPEFELRGVVSGPDLTTPSGTVVGTPGHFGAGEGPAKVYDDNEGTQWQPDIPAVVDYDFGSGNSYAIAELLIRENDSWTLRTPATLELYYSDDGSSWTLAESWAPGATWGSAGPTKVFRTVTTPTASTTCIYNP